ncbi:protein-S-isoprenylcysteine methyltransferase [Pokkaliibacter plantistimulans]|uniref:Protein-S-isoprenylcysteine methyltransferase n=1 Tax=Proteobacteria bacterium 228 TaxID=2083153 RepID=A0A2S5KP23_9PROT|nr:isoprenylcysteine carboxylmethyltransferase family protein [Pokkaliibacter plantistimulans]PPC76528.1 protein-S-isoprenylcysteine methyltransferase [Pokkaliibacter plantistimulans]
MIRIPPPLQALTCAALAWGIHHSAAFLPQPTVAQQWLFAVPHWLIGLLALLGLAIDLFAVWHFHRAATTVNPLYPERASTLVTHGIYRYSRNPMYVGLTLLLLAWCLWLGNLISLLTVALFVWVVTRLQIVPEERILAQRFGDEFRRYQQQVRRWL